MAISAAQLRAALGLIKWTLDDLAAVTGMAKSSLSNLRDDTSHAKPKTLQNLQRSLESAGVIFTDDEGVRLSRTDMRKLIGPDGLTALFDDIFNTTKEDRRDIVISGFEEKDFDEVLSREFAEMHMQRMSSLENFKMRCLLREGDYSYSDVPYCEYRWVAKEIYSTVPFYVYGDKLAIVVFNAPTKPEIALLSSRAIAEDYRRQFDAMWQAAKPTPKRRENLDG